MVNIRDICAEEVKKWQLELIEEKSKAYVLIFLSLFEQLLIRIGTYGDIGLIKL